MRSKPVTQNNRSLKQKKKKKQTAKKTGNGNSVQDVKQESSSENPQICKGRLRTTKNRKCQTEKESNFFLAVYISGFNGTKNILSDHKTILCKKAPPKKKAFNYAFHGKSKQKKNARKSKKELK